MAPAPRRVLFPFSGDTAGGSHLSALTLLAGLDRRRFEPLVVVHQDGPLATILHDHGIDFELLPPPPRPYVGSEGGRATQLGRMVTTAFRLTPILKRLKVDLIHTNDGRMQMTWALPARLSGTPMIWHQRTRHFPSALRERLARMAARIVCVSDYVAETLPPELSRRAERLYDPFDVRLAPGARSEAHSMILRAIGCEGDARIVGFVGTFNDQKRPLIFVDAAALIAERIGRPVRFVMFGADPNAQSTEIAARARDAGIAEQLHLMGFRTPLEPWLAGLDVLLAPGVNEAFGNAIVQATLMGVPVVAADSGGNPEILTEPAQGTLVPADDAGCFSAAATSILNAARSSVVDASAVVINARRFSAQAHCTRIMTLYDQVLAGRALPKTPGGNDRRPHGGANETQ